MPGDNVPAIIASGIRPPEFRDGLWFVDIVHECTDEEGLMQESVVGRYVLTTRGLRKAVWTAMRAVRRPIAVVAHLVLFH